VVREASLILKAIEKEGLQGREGDKSRVGRHRHIHDPGIQQEPLSNRNVPMSRYMLHHLMQTNGEMAGLPVEKRKFHCLKHSIATYLLDAGADLAFVKDWLGHANIQNTTIYARLTTATLDSTARKVFTSHRVV
jgi:integrase